MVVRPEEIALRGVEQDDLDLLLAWRQDREIMRYLPTPPERPTWDDHWRWWGTQMWKDPRDRHQMVVYHWGFTSPDGLNALGRRVGVVHCDRRTGEVGLIIGEKALWGQSVGTLAMEKLLREQVTTPYWESHRDFQGPIWALVHPDNTASRRLFESLNFVDTGEKGRHGQVKYLWQGWKE